MSSLYQNIMTTIYSFASPSVLSPFFFHVLSLYYLWSFFDHPRGSEIQIGIASNFLSGYPSITPTSARSQTLKFDFNLMTSRLIRWHKCLESILFSVFSGLSPTTFTSFWSSTGLGGLSNCSSMQVVYMNLKFMAMFPSGFMLVSPQLGALRKHLGILEA